MPVQEDAALIAEIQAIRTRLEAHGNDLVRAAGLLWLLVETWAKSNTANDNGPLQPPEN
jgi:hypothetical protein